MSELQTIIDEGTPYNPGKLSMRDAVLMSAPFVIGIIAFVGVFASMLYFIGFFVGFVLAPVFATLAALLVFLAAHSVTEKVIHSNV